MKKFEMIGQNWKTEKEYRGLFTNREDAEQFIRDHRLIQTCVGPVETDKEDYIEEISFSVDEFIESQKNWLGDYEIKGTD